MGKVREYTISKKLVKEDVVTINIDYSFLNFLLISDDGDAIAMSSELSDDNKKYIYEELVDVLQKNDLMDEEKSTKWIIKLKGCFVSDEVNMINGACIGLTFHRYKLEDR